jgi:hypothetical protein
MRDAPGAILDEAAHTAIGAAGRRRWLLSIRDDPFKDSWLTSRIREAETAGLHLRHLASRRRPWYGVEKMAPPHVLVGVMSRGRIGAILNEVQAIPSNSIYGLYVLGGPLVAAGLVSWLNTEEGWAAVQTVGRSYAGQLHKLEPRDWLTIRVPPTEELARLGGPGRAADTCSAGPNRD